MKLTYANQTIDLFDKENFSNPPERIVISLSGGLDSSSLTYLIATNFPDTEIYPFNTDDEDSPLDTKCAINIHKYLQNRFSSIKDLTLFDVKTTDTYWLQKAREELDSPKGKVMVNGKLQNKWRTVKGGSKALQNRHARTSMFKKYNTFVATGMTSNPPIEDMKRLGFYDVSERKRDPGKTSAPVLEDKTTYNPYLYVDKKFVAGVYKEHNLMNDLFPMTKSCAWVEADGNTNYPDPCNKCYWCNEKAWAFDTRL